MTRDEVGQLRVTAHFEYDAHPLPDAHLALAERMAVDGEVLAGTGGIHSTTLPPEAITRELRDADLHSSEGVAALLGTLGLDFARPLVLEGLGLIDRDQTCQSPVSSHPSRSSAPLIVEGRYISPDLLVAVASHGPGIRELEATIRSHDGNYEVDLDVRCGVWRQISLRLRVIRAAVNHYVNFAEGGDPVDAWTAEGFDFRIDHDLSGLAPHQPPDLQSLGDSRQADAWRSFIAVHAHFMQEHVPALAAWVSNNNAALRITSLPISLAAALIVQLHNFVLDGMELRRCTNETCGRPFRRQRGRALKGQYRNSGVIYCDAACAKAQMQRDYRRRKRQRAVEGVFEAPPTPT